MNNESLNGTLVFVPPDLTIDPKDGQGKVAIVNYESQQSNQLYLAFNNGKEAIYPAEAVLKLKDKKTILADLMTNGTGMQLDDFKDLYKISLLLDRGTNIAHWQALEVAGNNPAIWDKALLPAKTIEKQALEKTYTR